jgi:hypothetical protein
VMAPCRTSCWICLNGLRGLPSAVITVGSEIESSAVQAEYWPRPATGTPGIWGRLRSRQATSRRGICQGLGKQLRERRLYTHKTLRVYS